MILPDLRAAARDYLRRGLCTVPVFPDKRTPVAWKRYQRELPNIRTLDDWFALPDLTGIAIVCGTVSRGVVVRDFDQAGSYEAWRDAHPEDAATTPTVRTGRGWHVYGVSTVAKTARLPDGEVRASGSYAVAPPSMHASGHRYTWTVPLQESIPPLPDSLLSSALSHPPISPTHSLCQPIGEAQRLTAIDDAVEACVCTAARQRNDNRFELARRLRAILPPDTDGGILRPIFARWYALSVPFMRRKDETAEWLDFVRNWHGVKHPHGASWERIIADAETAPPPAACGLYPDHEALQRLVRLVAALQRAHGDEPFFLSGRQAGTAIGVDRNTTAELLRLLVFDRVLTLIRPGDRHQGGKASIYRFHG